jgi:peptide/nickel transport system substrate-binding protein/oligopeptide transport system substrate-binding protein
MATEPPAAEATEPPAAEATEPPAEAGKVVNRAGVVLPDDAAPIEEQVFHLADEENTWMTWDTSVYDENTGDVYAWSDSCARPDRDYQPQPNACTSWETSEDGLTWTFHLQEDKVWSDGTPLTADDWVFTLQRYARPDYDFEWFYSMAGIQNWNEVVSGELPPEELGVKKVDDYTFTVTTDRPAPFLIKIMADVWVAPKHIIKDRLADGSWAFDTYISAGPYVTEEYNRGEELVFVANDKYTGPFPPMFDKIIVHFMDSELEWNAYLNDELDAIGGNYAGDISPSAMAQIMAEPELQEQLISWPNFMTYYIFFDHTQPPFDDLKVRQAFSHAIDRDQLVDGPLQFQAVPAYSMNPPGFPGESVEALKDVQNFDPELAAQLLEEAGYPGGEGFPNLTLYTRNADPAQLAAAEVIAGMLKEHLGVTAEIQDMEYQTYMDKLYAQKSEEGSDMQIALVPYEFDFVDGSNLLSVWGGCEPEGAEWTDMPGRHTWYNKEYNDLNCEAGAIIGDEPRRNELYQQAERILVEDVGILPVWHSILNAMVKPDIKGPKLEPDDDGNVDWVRFRFASREALVYRAKEE